MRCQSKLSDEAILALHERTGVEQTVDTPEGAALIGKEPQTLRRWACYGIGPIKPIRIGGRLRWRVSDLKRLVSGEAA